jgi:uncharacterized protein
MQRPFSVLITDLIGTPGARRREQLSGPIRFETDLVTLIGDVDADLTLESMADGLLVRGEVGATVAYRCNRCLTEWEARETAPMVVVFGEEMDDEIHPIGREGGIDLEPMVRDELSLALPLVPLCRKECRGLCPTCGSDLNREPCSGHPEESGSPFAALRDLLGPETAND